MTEWQPIETAPFNGLTPQLVWVKVDGEPPFKAYISPSDEYVNEDGSSVRAWAAAEEGKHPKCWSNGVCWQSNEDEIPSKQPKHWQPLTPNQTG